MVVDVDRPTKDGWFSPEMGLPEAVTHHDHGRAPRLLFLPWQEAATEDGPHAKYVEIIRRGEGAPHALWLAGSGEVNRTDVGRHETGKAPVPVAQVYVVKVRKRHGVSSRSSPRESEHLAGMRNARDWIEQGRVDPTENRAVGANA